MKHILTFVLTLIISNTLLAQIGEPKGAYKTPKGFKQKSHNLFMSDRLKKSTSQRDSLYDLTIQYAKDTTDRGIAYRKLTDEFNDLTARYNDLDRKHKGLQVDYTEMNTRYTDLIKSSLSKTEQLNMALKQKGEDKLESHALAKHTTKPALACSSTNLPVWLPDTKMLPREFGQGAGHVPQLLLH
jgi:hypothetical protein